MNVLAGERGCRGLIPHTLVGHSTHSDELQSSRSNLNVGKHTTHILHCLTTTQTL